MKDVFSFDIGVASIGWAVLKHDTSNKKGSIIDSGVYTFPIGEHPKDGASLAMPRRLARSSRRRFERRRKRMVDIKALLNSYGYNIDCNNKTSLWQLRSSALERKLSSADLYKILLYFAKHRGYLSSVITEDKEEGKVKSSIQAFKKTLVESNCETAGQFLYCSYFQKGLRVKNIPNSYNRTLDGQTILEEIDTIIQKQRAFGNNIDDSFIKQYKTLQSSKAPTQSLEKMVGKCLFENKEYRAPSNSISFEIFRLLQNFNNLRIMNKNTGEYFQFTTEDKLKIINIARDKKIVKHSHIRKEFNIPDEFTFTHIRNSKTNDSEEKKEKNEFCSLKLYYDLHKIKNFSDEDIDKIAFILATCKDIIERKKILSREISNLSEDEIEQLAVKNTSKFGHVSIKAIKNIIPHMLNGLTYDKACSEAHYDFKQSFSDINSITNPVVKRVLHRYKRLLKVVVQKYGKPDIIKIETAKELGKSKEDRNKIEKRHKENQGKNQEAVTFFGGSANGKRIVKHKLWTEQGNICLYSGKHISEDDLKDDSLLQIDHIIPYSRCFDDSFSNKILSFTSENQNKGNKTPHEYLHPLGRFEKFADRVNASTLHKSKKAKCLIQNFEGIEGEFKSRNLNDTRYVTRLIAQHTESELETKVMRINGGVTAFARKSLGFVKERDKDDTHHALDAIVLGIVSQGYITNVNTDKKFKYRLKEPWEGFKKDVEGTIKKIKVIRFPIKKFKGSLHKDTIYGQKNGNIIKSISIDKITSKNIDNIHDKNGGAKPLYEALKQDLSTSGKITIPFSFNGVEVGSIKLIEEASNIRQINRGIVMMGAMPRVDIYEKNDKFYGVPVYNFDVLSNKNFKPTKIAPLSKNQHIDSTYTFKFSLYKDDLIFIKNQKGIEYTGYYKHFGISNCAIQIKTINGDASFPVANRMDCVTDVLITPLAVFQKMQIDYFGNISKVSKEKPPYDISELDNNTANKA
jgi:CRISPR-associated endonuclease Csn1